MTARVTPIMWKVIAACVVVASIAIGLTLFRSSDEDKIRATLTELGAIMAIKDGDTILSRTGRLRSRLPDVVDDDVRVDVRELSVDVRGREKLTAEAARVGLLYQKAEVDFTSVAIKIDPGATLATVDAVAVVTATRNGDRKLDKRDVHLLMRKDSRWKITTLDVAPPQSE